jgi:hypothetical protein
MNRNPAVDLLRDTLQAFKVPDRDSLARGDSDAIGILWQDRTLMLRLAAMEITYSGEVHRPEVESLLGDIKKTCLQCTPCLRKLLSLAPEVERSQESIDCATKAFEAMKSFLEEACEYLGPDLLSYHQVKFG